MSDLSLDIAQFLAKSRSLPVIDVRSPSEFEHAHIPGAVNLPLFSNEERSVIGTLYLQKGSSEAMTKGLEFIGPKLKEIAEAGHRISTGKELLMHCWRGGMRSNSMAWLMNTVGIKTYTLNGGYKSYRRFVQELFAKPLKLVVIGGMTGSGKSRVLEVLESMGEQILHLERLAKHRGSVFGSIGMPLQPSSEQFENEICFHLMRLNPEKPIYVEDESLAIGNVFIPRPLYEQMSAASFINLQVGARERVNYLISCYAGGDPELLINGIKKIEKRLGLQKAAQITDHIRQNRMVEAVEMVLTYYDKMYERSRTMHKRKDSIDLLIQGESDKHIAQRILNERH